MSDSTEFMLPKNEKPFEEGILPNIKEESKQEILKDLIGINYIKQEPAFQSDEYFPNEETKLNLSCYEPHTSEQSIQNLKPKLEKLIPLISEEAYHIKHEQFEDQLTEETDCINNDIEPLSPEQQEEQKDSNCSFQKDGVRDNKCTPTKTSVTHKKFKKGDIGIKTVDKSIDTSKCNENESSKIKNKKTGHNKSKPKVQRVKEPIFCDLCGKRFLYRCHILQHLREHTDNKQHVCNGCQKVFSRKDVLKKHVLNHCAKIFTGTDTLNKPVLNQFSDIKLTETRTKKHVCDICKKGFFCRNDLKRHFAVHKNDKDHLCDRCGKKFTQLGDLKRHSSAHTGREKHTCKTCGKSFQRRMSLLRHQVHHIEEKLLHCDVCGKSFTRKDCLKSHMFSHMPERPFVCQTCGKGFTEKSFLKNHSYTHYRQKPFPCSNCTKSFLTSVGLENHEKNCYTS